MFFDINFKSKLLYIKRECYLNLPTLSMCNRTARTLIIVIWIPLFSHPHIPWPLPWKHTLLQHFFQCMRYSLQWKWKWPPPPPPPRDSWEMSTRKALLHNLCYPNSQAHTICCKTHDFQWLVTMVLVQATCNCWALPRYAHALD